jgi:hypothetical protein
MGHKPRETSMLTISSDVHNAGMILTPEERKDRALVNETVRTGLGPFRPVGSADQYGVPLAEE